MAVVGEKGAGSEARMWEVKGSLIPKTKAHQLGVFSYSATKVQYRPYLSKIINILAVVVAGTSVRAAVWLEGAQESVDQARAVKRTPFLVARSGCNDYPSVQSSPLSGRVLAARCTDADNDEQSSAAGEHSSAVGRVVAEQHLQIQSLRREMR